jgi:hypothetical protein
MISDYGCRMFNFGFRSADFGLSEIERLLPVLTDAQKRNSRNLAMDEDFNCRKPILDKPEKIKSKVKVQRSKLKH